MDTNRGVATFTEVNRVCLKNGSTPALRAFYMLRHTAENGRGWHTVSGAIEVLVERLGITLKRANQLLNKGDGQFWTLSPEFVYLFGVKKLGEVLDLEKEGWTVYIPEEAFLGLQSFNAYAYASWFAPYTKRFFKYIKVGGETQLVFVGYKSISRAAVRELFGITRQTQTEYEHLTGMSVQGQVKREKPGTDFSIPEASFDGKIRGVYGYQEGGLWIYRQTSNRYAISLPCKRGRRRVFPKGGLSTKHEAEAARKTRYYFSDRKAAVTAVEKGRAPLGEVCVYTEKFIQLQRYRSFHILEVIKA